MLFVIHSVLVPIRTVQSNEDLILVSSETKNGLQNLITSVIKVFKEIIGHGIPA